MAAARLLLPCLALLWAGVALRAQDVQWADRIVAFSTQAGKPAFSARQALGEPAKWPAGGSCGCAWSPALWDEERAFTQRNDTARAETLKVGFAKPQKARRLYVAETFRPGAIRRIRVYDAEGHAELVHERGPRVPVAEPARLLTVALDGVRFKVAAVGLELDATTSGVPPQIDGVGLSSSRKAPEFPLALAEDKPFYGTADDPGPALNSRYAELLPRFAPEGDLVFVRKDHPENYGGFFNDDVWTSRPQGEGWSPAERLPAPVNDGRHNNVAGISADGVWTLTGRYVPDQPGLPGLHQRFAVDDRWSPPLNLEVPGYFNAGPYAEYHMDRERRVLLLSLEPVDTRGGRDLYVSLSDDQLTWSEPLNLGPALNTGGDEMAPWLAPDGRTLYFSSDGHRGYGSQDLFVAVRRGEGWTDWSQPRNLGPLLNTPAWESHYAEQPDGRYGWFARARDELGNTDLLRVALTEPPAEETPAAEPLAADSASPFADRFLLFGYVRDGATGRYLPAAELAFWPAGDSSRVLRAGTRNSQYQVRMEDGRDVAVRVTAPGFSPYRGTLRIDDPGRGVRRRDFTLWPPGQGPAEDAPRLAAGETRRIEGLTFRVNSAVIAAESYPALREWVTALEAEPGLRVTLEGHTNDRCSPRFCQKLSRARARKVADWFIDQGLEADRVDWAGFGAERPVADNDTEAGRARNQRVDIRVH